MEDKETLPGAPTESPARPDRGMLSRMEKIAFMVLVNRDLSARAALEAAESLERGAYRSEGAAAVAAAVRLADKAPPRQTPAEIVPPLAGGPGDTAAAAFLGTDPHSRALALAHLALGLSNSESASILGINPDSLEINVLSLAGRLHIGMSGPRGCGSPESHSAIAGAHGIEAESAAGSAHEASCAACAAMACAIRADRSAAGEALRGLLEPDREDPEIAAAVVMSSAALDRGARAAGPLMSRNSCLAVALMIGAAGMGLLWLLTEIFWTGWTGFGPQKETPQGATPGSRPANGAGAPAPREKQLDLESALADLRSRDRSAAERARSYLLSTGRASAPKLLLEREKGPHHRRLVDELFVEWARADNRAEESKARADLGLVRENARARAAVKASELSSRAQAIEATIKSLDAAIAKAKASGKTGRELEQMGISRASAVARKEAAEREAADVESLAAIIGGEIRAELEWRIARAVSRRGLIAGLPAVRMALGKEPSFPARAAFEAQRGLPVPPLSATPLKPLQALAAISRRVDFPVVFDPPALAGGSPAVDFPGSAAAAEDLIELVAAKTGCTFGVSDCAIVLFRKVDPARLTDMLSRFAPALSDPSAQVRAAAAFGVESITLRNFGFDPSASADSPGNRKSASEMANWLATSRTIRLDPETGRYVDAETGVGD